MIEQNQNKYWIAINQIMNIQQLYMRSYYVTNVVTKNLNIYLQFYANFFIILLKINSIIPFVLNKHDLLLYIPNLCFDIHNSF